MKEKQNRRVAALEAKWKRNKKWFLETKNEDWLFYRISRVRKKIKIKQDCRVTVLYGLSGMRAKQICLK